MKSKPWITAPMLAAFVYFLTICSEGLIANLDAGINMYLLISGLIQICAYFVPLLLYVVLFGGVSARKMRFHIPKAVSIPALILLFVILFFGDMLLSMLVRRVGLAGETAALTLTADVSKWVVLLVFAAIPAICEEVIFRGVIMSAFEGCGISPAIIGTSLLFAFAHMSIEHFFEYFFASVILCFAVYISRSIISSILIHIIYNSLSIIFTGYFEGIAANLESFALLFIVLLIIVWILTLLALGESSKVYRIYAARAYDSGYTPRHMTRTEKTKGSINVYFSVPFMLCALIYAAVVILALR